ncbi:hypothetical protein [Bacteroides oleiciplenus]|uniref:hypothetical protein n=1 Tax=Bacteroides oleiciplenus TaxID=626931 RepID=UPI0026DB1DFD|nr:hypothetical protein [Bacteroides oleiciplenus]
MKRKNQFNVLISFGINRKIKEIKRLDKCILLFLLCVVCIPSYAQYTGNLPALEQPIDQKYDYTRARNGQVFAINYTGSTPIDKGIWSLLTGSGERFRVCQNGTVAILGRDQSYPTLNFYTANNYFLGAIHAKDENLNLVGLRTINMYPRQLSSATAIFETTFTRLNTTLNLYNGNLNYLSIKNGRNQDATIINPAAKWLRIGSKNGIAFWGNETAETNDAPHFKISAVEVSSYVPMKIVQGNITVLYSISNADDAAWIGTTSNHGLHLGTRNSSLFFIDNTHNVYIGMTKQEADNVKQELKNKYRLFVTKGILSEDFAIAPKSTWADYVFNKDYNLRGLNEVEEFISENNHLPDVPSAKQVADEGYSQHDMNKALLQKIEELTLYVIKQEKKIATLESELDNLKK